MVNPLVSLILLPGALLLPGLISAQHAVPGTRVDPAVEFPEPGLDDPAAYEGYRTRFFRDARGNVLQVYLNQRHGRVVNLLANALNESAGFTVRDTSGRPAALGWGPNQARVQSAGQHSTVEYVLSTESSPLEIGRFLLGSMRFERDFQYQEGHLQPFSAPPFQVPELLALIANLERLPRAERQRHLALLNAQSIAELRDRLPPAVALAESDTAWVVRVSKTSPDGRNHLALELRVDRREADAMLLADRVVIRPRSNRPVLIAVSVTTDAPALTPLERNHIFSESFLSFYDSARQQHERILGVLPASRTPAERDRLLRFRRLDRQIRSVELMSYEEKLMAGLPNYATYFGRDMLMAALMMQPIWTPAMAEHVIASVLRKLTQSGEVSHEEALGGQAIRENAAAYNTLIAEHFSAQAQGQATRADSALTRARDLLADLQAVRENYVMVDDDFQFPVLVARYLSDSRVSSERKQAFLNDRVRADRPDSRITLLLRNLAYVARMSAPYAQEAVAANLVSFPQRDTNDWFPGSWRDSNAGYAGGRFAMDINVIWVPAALQSLGQIVVALRELGFSARAFEVLAPEIRGQALAAYVGDSLSLSRAVQAWQQTARHFWVQLNREQVRERVNAKLAWLPEGERLHWQDVIATRGSESLPATFLALSLDGSGQPIPVANTDPATHLFLEPLRAPVDRELRDVLPLLLPYPVGLFVAGLGPLVANDAYASAEIWENFRRDHYHGPRVVWGREVNLLLLGLTNQINAAFDSAGNLNDPALEPYVRTLHAALIQTLAAVEESGLKHTELWTYRIEDGRLLPVRYPVSTDIQLWNLTDLAVQYELARMPAALRTAEIPSLY